MKRLHSIEPARVYACVVAVIGVVTAFGLYALTDKQVAAVLALVSAVLAVVQGEATRAQVTPTSKVGAQVDNADAPDAGMTAGPADDAPTGTPVTVDPIDPDTLP